MRRVEAMLKELKQATGLDGRLTGTILDQGDAVGAWQSDSMAVVVFPTAETLKQARPDRPQPCRLHAGKYHCGQARRSGATI